MQNALINPKKNEPDVNDKNTVGYTWADKLHMQKDL